MGFILEGIKESVRLIVSFDIDLLDITFFTIKVSFLGTLLSGVTGIPAGFIIGISEFKGKKIINTILNTLMAMPTVVVGLLVYSLISRQGPFGSSGILFTPAAIVIGQLVLATPIITALTVSAIQSVDQRVRLTALSLGASAFQTSIVIVREARFQVMAAIIAGFGRVIAEVGAAMMLGGNIKGYTRTLTTAIALETSKGEFGFGMALGFILMGMAFVINIAFNYLQTKK